MNILLSNEEYDFLRALSRKRSRRSRDQMLRLPVLDAEAWVKGAASETGQRIVVVALTPLEAEWLNRITREQYGFITASERRARLVLREKIQRALQVAEVSPEDADGPSVGVTVAGGEQRTTESAIHAETRAEVARQGDQERRRPESS